MLFLSSKFDLISVVDCTHGSDSRKKEYSVKKRVKAQNRPLIAFSGGRSPEEKAITSGLFSSPQLYDQL
jgi:hypothetical protein